MAADGSIMQMNHARLRVDDFHFVFFLHLVADGLCEADVSAAGAGCKDQDFFHG